MALSYRLHKTENDVLLAIADRAIVGKSFSDNSFNLSVSKEFYGEAAADEQAIISLAKSATIINAIGEESIALLKKNKLVSEQEIRMICGLPHAQIFSIS